MSINLEDSVWMLNRYKESVDDCEEIKKVKFGSETIETDTLDELIEILSSEFADKSYTGFLVDISYYRDETPAEAKLRAEYERVTFASMVDAYKGKIKNEFDAICDLVENIELNLDESPDVYNDLNERQYELYQSLKQRYESKE